MTQSIFSTGGVEDDSSVFGQYPVASWKVGSAAKLSFPVMKIRESGGKRLVEHARPYREGEKLDDTGRSGKRWLVEVWFNNSIAEPGLDNGMPLYPDVLNALIASFDARETGDLELPTVGKVRARLHNYERNEDADTRDTAVVSFTFREDNEEALDRAAFRPPSVRATAIVLAEQTQFSAQAAGAWDDDTLTLFQAAGSVIDMLEAPGRFVGDVRAQSESVRRITRRIAHSQHDLAKEVGGDFNDPRGSAVLRDLVLLEDRMGLAESEKSASLPPTKPFQIDVEQCSLYDVAARFRQDAELLLDLNMGRVQDPFDLQRDDVVLIFA